jgi:hypothetical protein
MFVHATPLHRTAMNALSRMLTRSLALAVAIAMTLASPARAQMGMGGMGGMGGGMGGMGGGMGGMGGGMGGMGGMGGGMGGMGMGGMGGGFGSQAGAAGVVIDAQGVLRTQVVPDAGLSLAHRRAAAEALPADLRQGSPLRKVALSRLEAEVAKAVADGRGMPQELAVLAGLTRVQYVFVYPGVDGMAGEVVIAGPAEGWIVDTTGRVRGIESGRPTLLLEDLAAAVRAFPPGQPADRAIGCSIDPRQEGLAALQAFLRQTGRVNPRGSVEQLVAGMRQALGPQDVRIDGVSPASHFARVLVEADYRMKLIGIGLEPPPVPMKSWVELNAASGVAANAMQRWYFVPDYQCVKIAEDDLAIELVGLGVKLCGADEVVMADGRRMSAAVADRASRLFTDTFTRKYPDIAARHPVYAQLRNLIDLAVAAAYLQEHDAYGRAGWGAEVLRDERTVAIETYDVPREVEPAINAVWRGNRLVTPIGGGVTIQPRMALHTTNMAVDQDGSLADARATVADLPAGRWWWD